MSYTQDLPASVLHWNYRGFTEFPIQRLNGEESSVTDIYLKENLISYIPKDIGKLVHLESLYLSGNDIIELPKEISNLKGLKCLDVSGNRLTSIPDEVGELRSLKFLILDENELTELPLRLSELRFLRYLSVCDNHLQWLPQRPVHNYHHCEFRFWRNPCLTSIPYSLWYHMFRDQQTRSINIGCLNIPNYPHQFHSSRCRLKFKSESREWNYDVNCPPKYDNVLETAITSPPSLLEICKRALFMMISDTAKKLSQDTFKSIYCDTSNICNINVNNNFIRLEDDFKDFNIDNEYQINCDLNGNNLVTQDFRKVALNKSAVKKQYYVPSDVVEEHLNFLPKFIKRDLGNGPISRCENVNCIIPIFDYVLYEFCIGKIILIDNVEDVILSAALCSKPCVEQWKRGKSLIPWELVD